MPILKSSYRPSYFFRNPNISTIYPNFFRAIKGVQQTRERVTLTDGDFIDLDWSYATQNRTERLVIVLHGLEGNGQRNYMLGIAKHLNTHGWDVTAINLRSCSGEINKKYQSYTAGASDDLAEIITHITAKHPYTTVALFGFSLGGNIVLKYLGEERTIPEVIKAAVTISVPCDLYDAVQVLEQPRNWVYAQRFLKHLKAKLYDRKQHFPEALQLKDIETCTSLIDIDELYTSKAHGYTDAIDYYTQCSSKQFLKNITIPTLLMNAKNDSFLGEHCYPISEAKNNPYLYLEMPDYGGHVGFYQRGNIYYSDQRALAFLEEHCP